MKRGTRNGYHGMHWIRPEKRQAIYLRDGFACVYCEAKAFAGVTLSLDHLRPFRDGGTNAASNLVTACTRCNSSRGSRPWKEFAVAVAAYVNKGATPETIIKRVQRLRRRVLPMKEAKLTFRKNNS
jgi:5-methylcytosine-specific restriction endonuclease McrA